jgi:hypothetical protein
MPVSVAPWTSYTISRISLNPGWNLVRIDLGDILEQVNLADVRERDPIYLAERLGHPGLLQRVMNKVLVDNAILGPWIHVGSRMQLLSAARAGDEITARAKVIGNYDKKGHRFVELDALVVANGATPLAHCWHIAIYRPREQAAA